jgi:hypothetical protein
LEIQKLSMREISSIAWEAREIFKRLTGKTVQRIAYQRMPDGCQMDPDLMRASRIWGVMRRQTGLSPLFSPDVCNRAAEPFDEFSMFAICSPSRFYPSNSIKDTIVLDR